MLARLREKLLHGPRRPLAGVALAAIVGILLAEGYRALFVGHSDGGMAAWGALGLCVGCGWIWMRRRQAGWLWIAVAAGYGTLHLLGADPVPARTLARVLALPTDATAGGTAHVLHGTGTVLDVPRVLPSFAALPGRPVETKRRFTLRLERVQVDGWGWPCHADVSATWRDGPRALGPGDRLEITALAENLAPPRNPGEYDRAGHLRREGILSTMRIAGVMDGRVLPPASGVGRWVSLAPLRRVAGTVHGWMERTLSLDLSDDPEAASIVATTLLGLSSAPGLGPLENTFQRTGTLHYFAVDGLKLALVAFLLLRALPTVGVRRPWTGVCVLPLLVLYALATGLSVASARAVIFAAVLTGGEWLDRPAQPLNNLGAAAAGVLLCNTQGLFDLSFQLTFSVMLAILLLGRPLDQWLRRIGAPDPFLPPALFSKGFRAWEWLRQGTCGLTAVSVTAWLGTLPLMLGVFHLFSPVSLVANILTFPLAFAVLALGIFALVSGTLSTVLAVWFNNANWLVAKMFLGLVRFFDAVPGGSFAVAAPSHWHWPAPAATLVVYDFDRGRAASLRAGRAEWLLDAARLSEYSVGVLPCLRARAVERLDGGLLLTQSDADHLAAARLAVTDLHPAQIVESALSNHSPLLRDFHQFLADERRTETFCRRGDVLPLGDGVRGTVLYPPDDLSGRFRSAADRALVVQVEAAGWRVLLLTEGNGAAARWLTTQLPAGTLASEVLVTAGAVSPDLLAAVHPRLVVLRAPVVKEAADSKPAPPVEVPALPPTLPVFAQHDSGAVTLLIYPDHLEAEGFVDRHKVRLRK